MSRELPRRPSLDHLKKQAKELLRELRLREPRAALTDAQHALAREYGFASWPKLKAHVELAAATPPETRTPLFDRFTYKARQALFFARFEASSIGTHTIAAEHLLLGVMRASHAMSGSMFESTAASIDDARVAIVTTLGRAEKIPTSVEIPFALDSRRVVVIAGDEADAMGHSPIGLVHIALAACEESEAVGALMRGWGLSAEFLRANSKRLLDAEPAG